MTGCTFNRGVSRFVAVGLEAAILALPVFAVDKNGVSPLAISKPAGPGSLEGLGDAFQPSLNTGMARYSVSFALPEGVAGLTPMLGLQYDSGRGCMVAGMGWTLDPGSVRRQTDEGQPNYFDQPVGNQPLDRFLGPTGEELIPLVNGYYLSKNESSFLRFRRVDDHWEARTKSGVTLEYGISDEARVSDPMGKKVYRWWLERQTDTHGNVIEYSYARPDEDARQVYLIEVRYGPGAPPWDHFYSVSLTYEGRPDQWTDYRPGFKIATTRRLKRVDVLYDGVLIRRFELGYEADPNQSLLTTITQYGSDGIGALPRTTFGYATFPLGDPDISIDASSHTIGSVGEPPFVLDSPRTEVIDLNSDGLPDLLRTDTVHLAYLNLGVHEIGGKPMVLWDGPVPVTTEDEAVLGYGLSDSPVYLADMNGDGTADWIVSATDGVDCFANTGHVGWSRRRRVTVQKSPPPAPYSAPDGSVLSSDLDFDKKMDVIKAEDGVYSVWMFEAQDGQFSDRILTPGARYKGKLLQFGRAGVQLADMNGDRLTDAVEVTSTRVVYCPSMGFGLFDECIEMTLPPEDPALEPDQIQRAKITDINNDGLSDLVVERFSGSDLRFWLHKPDGTFARSRFVTGLPSTPNSVTRWADINGNGTVDLIYADSSLPDSRINVIDIGVLIAGSAHYNALTSIENGYGRRTQIAYRSMTDFYLDSVAAGNAWNTTVPFPVPVVSRTVISIGLNLDGYPDEGPLGDQYLTDFVYRDGYYDPQQEQFRGFAFVKQIARGDERFGGSAAPTLVTRVAFNTGAPDGIDNDGNGEIDEFTPEAGREEEPLKGAELWRETTSLPDDPAQDGGFSDPSITFERMENSYEVRVLASEAGGALAAVLGEGYRTMDRYGRTVRQLVPTVIRRTIFERGSGPGRTLQMDSDLDALGNKILNRNFGDLAAASDDLHTETEFAINEANWIVDRAARTVQRDGLNGHIVSDARQYYDGDPFVGLPLGQVGSRGLMHRKENLVSFEETLPPPLDERSIVVGDPRDPDGRVDALRQKFDAYGNVIVSLDGNAGLTGQNEPDGSGHTRIIEFDDALHKFAVRETAVAGAKAADLDSTATYHFGFATPLSITDWNGDTTRYEFDLFGRLVKEILPGDDSASPSAEYSYSLGAPVSRIITRQHTADSGSPDVETVRFFDGLGRKLGVVELGGPVTKEATFYDTRGFARKELQPFAGGSINWSQPADSLPARTSSFDAQGRVIRVESPADLEGNIAVLTTEYLPLTVRQSDGEDNRTGNHSNTPRTFVHDGLNRLIEVRLIEGIAEQRGTFATRYRYAMPDRLAEIEDANGNVRYMRFDGLGRKIYMNDADRGMVTYTYDAVGNLIETSDAKSQRIQWSFDGVNRVLSEDYLDDGSSLSHGRQPDVQYHYDQPSAAFPWLRNTRGRVAWVEDLSGTEFLGYDNRGDLETVVKQVDQAGGGQRTFMTTTLSDSLHRVYEIIYPDGGVVRYGYNARGLLAEVSGFIDELTYNPASQRKRVQLANGVLTEYEYDDRLRPTRMASTGPGGTIQDLSYDYDQADNLIRISDGRSYPATDPRSHFASFLYDDCYRLVRASSPNTGDLRFEYDPIHNMVFKTNPMNSSENLPAIGYGGAGGTQNRIGRGFGDPPGPHAATSTHQPGEKLSYDMNGNLVSHNSAQFSYDFRDRLRRLQGTDASAEYLYDYSSRRVIKRVGGEQTTYVSRMTETRGDRTIHYAFAGDARCARVEGTLLPPNELSQRIGLREGWNLVSFQLAPASTDPAVVLAPILDKLIAVFAWNNGSYARFVPHGINKLGSIAPNEGLWLHMAEAADWVIQGSLARSAVPLAAGESRLAGIPGLAPREMASVFEGITGAAIWRYDGDDLGWSVYDPSAAAFLNTLTHTRAGEAYWIRPKVATSILFSPPAPPEIHWYVADHLGSTDLMTNSVGVVASETIYFPYGQTRYRVDPGGATPNEYQFTGKERDEETGLYFFDGRYYSPRLGRFITVDPLLGETPNRESKQDKSDTYLNEPENFNLYAYAQNNPLSRIDPTGTETVYLINKARTEITVRTNIVIYGPQSSPAVATRIKQLIEDKWNKGFKYDGKTVKFDVSVKVESQLTVAARKQYGNPGSPDLIYIGNHGRSNVTDQWFGNIYNPLTWATMSKGGSWYIKYDKNDTSDELARVTAHEYGHIIGLPDRYKDVKRPDGTITSVEDPGWEGNMMASDARGKLEQRNIDEALQGKEFKQEK